MSIHALYHLARCEDTAIAGRAQAALQLTESVNRGDITRDEYQELCRDLVRMAQLDRECSAITVKTALVHAIYLVAQLV